MDWLLSCINEDSWCDDCGGQYMIVFAPLRLSFANPFCLLQIGCGTGTSPMCTCCGGKLRQMKYLVLVAAARLSQVDNKGDHGVLDALLMNVLQKDLSSLYNRSFVAYCMVYDDCSVSLTGMNE